MIGFRTRGTSARSAFRFLPFLNRGRKRRLARLRRGMTEAAGLFAPTIDVSPSVEILEDRTLLSVDALVTTNPAGDDVLFVFDEPVARAVFTQRNLRRSR